MTRTKTFLPAERELEILTILWEIGPSSVRSVNEEMNKSRSTGYTTTLKLMQIMHEKKLLVRDETKWPHIYTPAIPEEKTQSQLVGHLLEKAFNGSAEKLVMRALSSKNISRKELTKIRRLLDKMKGN